MFAQTISSRNPTAPISTISAGRDEATSCSLAAVARALQPSLLFLNSVAIRPARTVNSCCACAKLALIGEAPDHQQRSRTAGLAVEIFGIEGQRRPDLDVGAGWELELRRHDADHRERHRVELNRLADEAAIPAQDARPEAMAQHHDAIGANHRLFRHEGPAEHGV